MLIKQIIQSYFITGNERVTRNSSSSKYRKRKIEVVFEIKDKAMMMVMMGETKLS